MKFLQVMRPAPFPWLRHGHGWFSFPQRRSARPFSESENLADLGPGRELLSPPSPGRLGPADPSQAPGAGVWAGTLGRLSGGKVTQAAMGLWAAGGQQQGVEKACVLAHAGPPRHRMEAAIPLCFSFAALK